MTTQIARLKVTLDWIEPQVLRRIEVPADMRLDRLHLTLQAAMGWTNSHLFAFSAKRLRWSLPSPYDEDDGTVDARKTTLADALAAAGGKSLHYTYDFGDSWEHAVKVEKLGDADPAALYPRLLDVEAACPPEDCGGPPGYIELRAALADPGHERHQEVRGWMGPDFNPSALDADGLKQDVAALAKRWARKPAARKPKLG